MLYEVIVDIGETANKCTIVPLSYRPDFRLLRVKNALSLGPLQAKILLHPNGECLTQLRKTWNEIDSIACIDCVWRRLDGLIRRISGQLPTFARIPDGFVTAYPRKSEANHDPASGLATIEAIFIATALLGKWDITLLSEYYFGHRFLELNSKRFLELGVTQAAEPNPLPLLPNRSRNSEQRRRDRGQPTQF